MLQIEGVSVLLGGRMVLEEVSLEVPAGQILAICGANGAGKSTLLRAILGEIPLRGRVRLNGRDALARAPAELARIRAVLPQHTHVAFAYRVAEIVAMGQEAGDFAARKGLVQEALAAVGLMGHEARDIQSLSGGEAQRVHLARALAQVWEPRGPGGPRWLFLDEPVAALDLGHQLQVMRLARRFAAGGGGVVMVMHDLNLTAHHADRLAFLGQGRIEALGSPAEVITASRLQRAYGCRVALNTAPAEGPWFLPQCCETLSLPGGA